MTDLFDLLEARMRNGDDPGDPLRTLYVEDGFHLERALPKELKALTLI